MFKRINTPAQVKSFASMLINEGINLHPDTDFGDYINLKTGEPSFTKEEAALRNKLMDQCRSVCSKNEIDIDIYDAQS